MTKPTQVTLSPDARLLVVGILQVVRAVTRVSRIAFGVYRLTPAEIFTRPSRYTNPAGGASDRSAHERP